MIADYRAWPALLICFRWSLLFPLFSFFVPAHILWCVLSPSSNRCSHREIETSHATVDSLLHFQTDQDLLFEVTSVCASVTSFVKALHRSVGTEKKSVNITLIVLWRPSDFPLGVHIFGNMLCCKSCGTRLAFASSCLWCLCELWCVPVLYLNGYHATLTREYPLQVLFQSKWKWHRRCKVCDKAGSKVKNSFLQCQALFSPTFWHVKGLLTCNQFECSLGEHHWPLEDSASQKATCVSH